MNTFDFDRGWWKKPTVRYFIELQKRVEQRLHRSGRQLCRPVIDVFLGPIGPNYVQSYRVGQGPVVAVYVSICLIPVNIWVDTSKLHHPDHMVHHNHDLTTLCIRFHFLLVFSDQVWLSSGPWKIACFFFWKSLYACRVQVLSVFHGSVLRPCVQYCDFITQNFTMYCFSECIETNIIVSPSEGTCHCGVDIWDIHKAYFSFTMNE